MEHLPQRLHRERRCRSSPGRRPRRAAPVRPQWFTCRASCGTVSSARRSPQSSATLRTTNHSSCSRRRPSSGDAVFTWRSALYSARRCSIDSDSTSSCRRVSEASAPACLSTSRASCRLGPPVVSRCVPPPWTAASAGSRSGSCAAARRRGFAREPRHGRGRSDHRLVVAVAERRIDACHHRLQAAGGLRTRRIGDELAQRLVPLLAGHPAQVPVTVRRADPLSHGRAMQDLIARNEPLGLIDGLAAFLAGRADVHQQPGFRVDVGDEMLHRVEAPHR